MDDDLTALLTHSLRSMFAAGGEHAAALADLGWDDVQGAHGAAADALLFHEQGRALVASPLLDTVVLAAVDGLPPDVHAVVHPWQPDRLAAGGALLGPPSDTGRTLLVHDGGVAWAPSSALTAVRRLEGFARDTAWYAVDRLDEVDWTPVAGADPSPAIAAAHRALAAEISGVCEAALALVVEHTTNRRQYGRPIASFQAVRHRLAEAHVADAAARDVLEVAVASADQPGAAAWAARVAKITAGRAQSEVMRSAVQFFGALGVTQESAVHRWVSRAATLDALHGSHRHLTEQLGRALLDGAPLDAVVGI